MMFDREGYSPKLFAQLRGRRIATQTYRKELAGGGVPGI
jgi:hypothetical protein